MRLPCSRALPGCCRPMDMPHTRRLRRDVNDVVLAHCWAHSRRKFFDLAKGGSAPAAERVLALIAELYRIEQEIRGSRPTGVGTSVASAAVPSSTNSIASSASTFARCPAVP